MEMHSVYILWFLLPLWFFMYGCWAYFKRHGRRPVREHPSEYFGPGVFTALGLALAIWLDQTIYQDLVDALTAGLVDVMIARWLLYPGILLLMAYASKFFKKKDGVDGRVTPGKHYRA